MSIVKWKVSNWLSEPEHAVYTKQTTHFYIRPNGGRDSIVCRYYSYFDSEADALAFIKEKKAQRLHAKNVDRIKSHGVELLEALEEVMKHYPFPDSVIASNAKYAIAKAKGEQQ
jgi:hypothetical protein